MSNFNHISIVISTRNSVNYIDQCLLSALNQNYPDFSVIFIDACSNDGTYEAAKKYEDNPKLTVLQNDVRKYQGENIRIGVEISKEKAIIITLDGDDWFPHAEVLSTINKVYNDTDCWMTYGSYVEHPYRNISGSYFEYPLEVRQAKQFRDFRWLASHLRTFRRELFLKINVDDLIDPITNDFFENVCDLSFQFPMLEMCGVDKSLFLSDTLYVYNTQNIESDFLKDRNIINRIESFIRSKTPYETLTNLY